MTAKTIYLIHGYTANSQSHWFPWLKERLNLAKFHIHIFDMPNTQAPQPAQWQAYLRQHITQCDENTLFIGHSLGCINILSYLQQQQKKVKGVILVSGFDESLPNLPELNAFTQSSIHYAQLIPMLEKRTVIASSNDSIVPPQYSQRLSQHLQANYLTVENSGHFLAREGITELPIVYEEVLRFFK